MLLTKDWTADFALHYIDPMDVALRERRLVLRVLVGLGEYIGG